jgi:hypothetical protein
MEAAGDVFRLGSLIRRFDKSTFSRLSSSVDQINDWYSYLITIWPPHLGQGPGSHLRRLEGMDRENVRSEPSSGLPILAGSCIDSTDTLSIAPGLTPSTVGCLEGLTCSSPVAGILGTLPGTVMGFSDIRAIPSVCMSCGP